MSEAAYDAIAEWYDEIVRAGGLTHDLILPAVYALIGQPRGQRICDLACGQGILSRSLAHQGANVVSLDFSGKLLELARRYPNDEPSPLRYVQGDAQRLPFAHGVFDGVVCNMALMDIPDLKAVCIAVNHVLKAHGWFVFSLTHPCLETIKAQARWIDTESGAQAITSYFVEGLWRSDNLNGVRGKVGAYHRTLSTYLNTLAQAGFTLEQVIEPQAAGDFAERYPTHQAIPAALVARCRKAQDA